LHSHGSTTRHASHGSHSVSDADRESHAVTRLTARRHPKASRFHSHSTCDVRMDMHLRRQIVRRAARLHKAPARNPLPAPGARDPHPVSSSAAIHPALAARRLRDRGTLNTPLATRPRLMSSRPFPLWLTQNDTHPDAAASTDGRQPRQTAGSHDVWRRWARVAATEREPSSPSPPPRTT